MRAPGSPATISWSTAAGASGKVAVVPAPSRPPAPAAALRHARRLVARHPVIDGHNDLPWTIRNDAKARGDVETYDLRRPTRGDTDLARLKAGGVGGQFWSVYIPGDLKGGRFARTQLEQIDIARRVIERYPGGLQPAFSAAHVDHARPRPPLPPPPARPRRPPL